MNKYFFVLILFFAVEYYPQVTVSTHSIFFPQLITNTVDSLPVYIKNNSNQLVNIKLKNLKTVFTLSDTMLSVSSNDSTILWIKYSPNQNVIDKDLILISSNDFSIGNAIELNGSGKYVDNYNTVTFNLYDAQLKTVLTQIVSGHTALGYNGARDKMFMEIDNKKVNGQGATQNTLECVYTGRLAVGYANRTEAQNNFNFNTEHTWPQFSFNEDEPMKSDLYHLYPTDNPANGVRSNYPFGKVVNATWENNGSKLGTNSANQIVFEPRDVHKGNVSRSMFYFITCYPTNYGGFFTQAQENVFRVWNKLDVVDAAENARNNAIALLQLKRNPFIDHPEFVDRIYSFATSNVRPTIAVLDVLPLIINFDSTKIGSSSSKEFYLTNEGSGQLRIDSISISNSRFSLNVTGSIISPYSLKTVSLQFQPDSIKNYSALLTVYSNVGTKLVTVSGIGKDNTVGVDDVYSLPVSFTLEQNYPNPFNPSTKISWQSPVSGWQTLKIYDALGSEVETLVKEYKEAGVYSTLYNVNSTLASGVYFYRLQIYPDKIGAVPFVETKKMILIR
jgi:endonuclease I